MTSSDDSMSSEYCWEALSTWWAPCGREIAGGVLGAWRVQFPTASANGVYRNFRGPGRLTGAGEGRHLEEVSGTGGG
jgi:hypothetical protein